LIIKWKKKEFQKFHILLLSAKWSKAFYFIYLFQFMLKLLLPLWILKYTYRFPSFFDIPPDTSSSRTVFLNRRDASRHRPGTGTWRPFYGDLKYFWKFKITNLNLNMTEIVEFSQWKKYLNFNSSKICIYFGIFGCM